MSALPWTDPRHPWMRDALVLDVEHADPDETPAYVAPVRRCLYCAGPLVGFQLRFCCYAHRDRHGKERRAAASREAR